MGLHKRLIRWRFSQVLTFGLGVLVTSTFLLALWPVPPDQCDCTNGYPDDNKGPAEEADVEDAPGHRPRLAANHEDRNVDSDNVDTSDHLEWGPHKLAIVIPFRDRFDELMEFAPHMHNFLNAQRIRHKIYVVNQQDMYRFNRASLINIGFLESRVECDYIAMHDVDLLPLNPLLNYSYPIHGPYHIASPDLHPKYHYPTFVGGILLLNNKHFQILNGLSNRYWGWGREDDEFYVRIKEAGLEVGRPKGIHTGYDTFRHIHERSRRPRDNKRYGNQKNAGRRRDRITGVDTVQYKVLSTVEITLSDVPVTILNVELACDLTDTPWCVTPDQLPTLINALPPEQRSRITKELFGDRDPNAVAGH